MNQAIENSEIPAGGRRHGQRVRPNIERGFINFARN